jgi:hypothetical protein
MDSGLGGNEKACVVIYGAWLFASVVALSWFDKTIVTALLHFGTHPTRTLVFETVNPNGEIQRIYPFTLVSALVSLIGVTYYIFRREKKWWAIPIGLLAARAVTLGMINLYEQIFIGLGQIVWKVDIWSRYYGGDPSNLMWTILAILWNITTLPWWQRKNAKPAAICFGLFLVVMLIWLLTGYHPVESGNYAAYVLNATSRLLSQTTQVILVRNSGRNRYVSTLDTSTR